ncbi:hypothetical protein SCAR479_00698 [Seiridium cardinale]|uniref:Uncharacterized protein n=1 Tax=Seiridium cardinale TaxID=138064 RepID=A0ABR2YAA4_9PEZI
MSTTSSTSSASKTSPTNEKSSWTKRSFTKQAPSTTTSSKPTPTPIPTDEVWIEFQQEFVSSDGAFAAGSSWVMFAKKNDEKDLELYQTEASAQAHASDNNAPGNVPWPDDFSSNSRTVGVSGSQMFSNCQDICTKSSKDSAIEISPAASDEIYEGPGTLKWRRASVRDVSPWNVRIATWVIDFDQDPDSWKAWFCMPPGFGALHSKSRSISSRTRHNGSSHYWRQGGQGQWSRRLWVGASNLSGDDKELESDVYRISDVLRGAHSLVIAVGQSSTAIVNRTLGKLELTVTALKCIYTRKTTQHLLEPYCRVVGISGKSKNLQGADMDAIILDGAFEASIQWKSFYPAKYVTGFSWKRWLYLQLMESNAMLLSIALFAWAIGQDWSRNGKPIVDQAITLLDAFCGSFSKNASLLGTLDSTLDQFEVRA